MRFLVLGDFTAHDRRGLGERPVHSIMPGMNLGSFMEELRLSARIDEPGLKAKLLGKLEGQITGKFKAKPQDPDGGMATLKITGTGTVSGDFESNKVGSFTGPVTISGEIKDVPYKFVGDEAQIDLDKLFASDATYDGVRVFGKVEPPKDAALGETGVTGNIEQFDASSERYVPRVLQECKLEPLPDNDIALDSIDPELVLGPTKINHAEVEVDLTIPLRSMNDFKPLHLAAMVPELRRLVLLRSLALETRNYLANYPELRDLVKAELTPDGRFPALRAELRRLYPQLLVSPKQTAETHQS